MLYFISSYNIKIYKLLENSGYMVEIGLKKQEQEYKAYLNKYVMINILPQGQTYYGQLKSFDKRKAILNPYRGDKLNNGKLENCLLDGELTIELMGLNIKIEETSKELIERWCQLETMSNLVKEKEITEKYKHSQDNQ